MLALSFSSWGCLLRGEVSKVTHKKGISSIRSSGEAEGGEIHQEGGMEKTVIKGKLSKGQGRKRIGTDPAGRRRRK